MITLKERAQIEKVKEKLSKDSMFVRAYRESKNENGNNVGVTRRSLIKSAMCRYDLPTFTEKNRAYIYSLLEKYFDSQFNLCPYGIDNIETAQTSSELEELTTEQIYQTLSSEWDSQSKVECLSLTPPFSLNDLIGEPPMSTVSIVEKVLLVDGQPASKLTDMQLVSKLSALQGNIKFLSETDTGSKKIASMIEAAKSQIKLIVDELDSRE